MFIITLQHTSHWDVVCWSGILEILSSGFAATVGVYFTYRVCCNSWFYFRYIHQVIDETLRWSRLTPWIVRYQDFDSELGGHKIPKNVWHCVLSLNKIFSNKLWELYMHLKNLSEKWIFNVYLLISEGFWYDNQCVSLL